MKDESTRDAEVSESPCYLVIGEFDDGSTCWSCATKCETLERAISAAEEMESDKDCRCAIAYQAFELTPKPKTTEETQR